MKQIYDIVTKQFINIPKGKQKIVSDSLGLDYTTVGRVLNKKHISTVSRYIHPENLNKLFTLVDFDTKNEYDCIDNFSLGLYFGRKLTDNETKYVYELKAGRQALASIFDKVFYLKGAEKTGKFKPMKNQTPACAQETARVKLQQRIYNALLSRMKYEFVKKKGTTRLLTGCSYSFLMGWLERQFTQGMTWDNYGDEGWHMDHIRPCSTFDLTQEEQQYECFNYTNLQPLWATTAIAKKFGENNYIGNMNKGCRNIKGGVVSPIPSSTCDAGAGRRATVPPQPSFLV